MTTDYQKQANDFLKATKTTFTTSFKGHVHPTWDEEHLHDSFSCVLQNLNHKFRFTFYQSRNLSTGTGKNKPTAYDVLAGITNNEVGTFEDFCSDYSYDTDSRKAYKTYKAVLREWKNVERLWTPEQIEQLQEIQ